VEVAERLELIRRLCSFEGRRAGTDAERRAANDLAKRLGAGGRRADVEPTYVHPQWALVHAAHCALAVAGGLVALEWPAIGFVVVLLTAVSMYLDLNGRFYLLRRLFFRRASQNVVARGMRPDAPARVVLCAHYDAARTGRAFDPGPSAFAARLQRAIPLPIGPFRILFWSLALLLPVIGARMAGIEAGWLSAIQLVPTLVLILGVFLLVDISLSPTSPGANDNASGVATAISLAGELDGDPPANLDVWVLLTGAEECLQEGMRSFLRKHRDDLPRESTYFVCLDTVGEGEVRFEAAAGWVVTFEMDRHLVELCEAIATTDGDRPRGRALRDGYGGDGVLARTRRYRSTTITCIPAEGRVPDQHTHRDVPDRIDPDSLERAHGFALDLVRLLDRDVGRRARSR
jgi:Peptidase family M28